MSLIQGSCKKLCESDSEHIKSLTECKDIGGCIESCDNNYETGLTHECGLFAAMARGCWPTSVDVARVICLGLVGLQHRGQESAGIATSEGECTRGFNVHRDVGLIGSVFSDATMSHLRGNLGIGHTRYATSGGTDKANIQPFVVHTVHGAVAVAHNGELMNKESLRREVLARGVGLSTHSDSELIAQSLCCCPAEINENNGPDWPARIRHFMALARLSYSLVVMFKDKLYAVRDSHGNRPFCLGEIMPTHTANDSEPEGWVISSESCCFLSIGARYVREIQPGEILELSRDGPRTICVVPLPNEIKNAMSFCIFEYVYFARSDSRFEGQMVYTVRMECGRQLWREAPVEADIVSSVPESGTPAAIGYARESGIEFTEALCRNRYVGRTFIQPTPRLRQLVVAKKFGALSENVAGKRLVLIDDSIVRGNTIGPIIKLLRDAGAREVHIRIASPAILHPCYMGINIPTREELIATLHNIEKLAEKVGADSLAYLSIKGLVEAVSRNRKVTWIGEKNKGNGYCTACLSGEYPEPLPKELQW